MCYFVDSCFAECFREFELFLRRHRQSVAAEEEKGAAVDSRWIYLSNANRRHFRFVSNENRVDDDDDRNGIENEIDDDVETNPN